MGISELIRALPVDCNILCIYTLGPLHVCRKRHQRIFFLFNMMSNSRHHYDGVASSPECWFFNLKKKTCFSTNFPNSTPVSVGVYVAAKAGLGLFNFALCGHSKNFFIVFNLSICPWSAGRLCKSCYVIQLISES